MQSLKTKRGKELENIKKIIVPILKKNGVVRAGIFGSFARGDAKKGSDVDILIKYDAKKRKSLFDLVGLEQELEGLLKRKVDVVTYNSVHPLLRDRIMDEEVRLYEER